MRDLLGRKDIEILIREDYGDYISLWEQDHIIDWIELNNNYSPYGEPEFDDILDLTIEFDNHYGSLITFFLTKQLIRKRLQLMTQNLIYYHQFRFYDNYDREISRITRDLHYIYQLTGITSQQEEDIFLDYIPQEKQNNFLFYLNQLDLYQLTILYLSIRRNLWEKGLLIKG